MGQLRPWLDMRRELPLGSLLCVINGTTHSRYWSSAAAPRSSGRTAAAAGVTRRFAPHDLRQLGHSNLGISSVYQPPATPGSISLPGLARRQGLRGFIQGYNAPAVTSEDQVVIAAEVMVASPDSGHRESMLHAARRELEAAGRHRATRGGARRRRLLPQDAS
jgi:hypothetical protein